MKKAPKTEDDQAIQCMLNRLENGSKRVIVNYIDLAGDPAKFEAVSIFTKLSLKEYTKHYGRTEDLLKIVACDGEQLKWLLYQNFEVQYGVFTSIIKFSMKRIRQMEEKFKDLEGKNL